MGSLRDELSATRQDLSLQFARAAFPDYDATKPPPKE